MPVVTANGPHEDASATSPQPARMESVETQANMEHPQVVLFHDNKHVLRSGLGCLQNTPEHPPLRTPMRSSSFSSPVSSRNRLRFFRAAGVRVMAGAAATAEPAPEQEVCEDLCQKTGVSATRQAAHCSSLKPTEQNTCGCGLATATLAGGPGELGEQSTSCEHPHPGNGWSSRRCNTV